MGLLSTKFDDEFALAQEQNRHAAAMQAQALQGRFYSEQAQRQHEMAMNANKQDYDREMYQTQKADRDAKNEGLLRLGGMGGFTVGHTGKPGGYFRKSLLS